jgi:hypothetical protein
MLDISEMEGSLDSIKHIEESKDDISKIQEEDMLFVTPDQIDQNIYKEDKTRRPHWCFTIHNYYISESETLEMAKERITKVFNNLVDTKKIQFYSVGFENGKSNTTPHLQGYLFTGHGSNKTFSAIKKILKPLSDTPYLAYMYHKSSWQKCVNYTKKEHDFISGGKEPQNQDHKVEIKLDTLIEEVYNGKKIQELVDRDPLTRCLAIKCYKTLQRAEYLYQEKQPYYPPFVCWFFGKTGTGKTTMVNILEEYLEENVFEVTCDNGFFEGYNSEKYIYFDDYRSNPSDLTFNKLLSLTCEKKNMRVNIKGSSVPWRPRIIIFTSPNGIVDAKPMISQTSLAYNKKIDENFKQFKRRVHVSLKFNFDTENDKYPGEQRIQKQIKEQGIPLFLRYYKYHCIKHNIPLSDKFLDIEPLQYEIDKLKDETPRDSDGINHFDHQNI